MARVIIGNHAAVVVPRKLRQRVHAFYCDVLGFERTRQTPDKDDLQLGEVDPFFLSIVYGEVADESELLRSGRAMFLELKTDDVGAMRERILASGILRLDLPDPHLYFQAPSGQVFRLIGIDEDMTGYERDVVGDGDGNARLAAAVRRDAERLDE